MTFDAKKARANTDAARSVNGDYLRKETNNILTILEVASKSKDSHTFGGRLDKVIVDRLKILGFKVVEYDGDSREPQDYGSVTISW